jgi:hypothetical protein
MRRLPLLLAIALAGCFAPENPDCAFRCDVATAMNGGHCPDDYYCGSDGYCHVNGGSGVCPFDLLAVPDAATPVDASMSVDQPAPAPGDMTTAADLTTTPAADLSTAD